MTFNVLISCMHEKDFSILERSNVQSDVVVINQCDKNSTDEFNFKNKKGENCHCKFISTTERGLSCSRNAAIRNAWGDICLICDDDEVLKDDLEGIILGAYQRETDADVIAFALDRKDHPQKYSNKQAWLGFFGILRTSSQQITFRKQDILDAGIIFDEKMGSGTGNGGGEENKFLMDCRRGKLKILYEPTVITTIMPGDSQWFKGFTNKYFRDKGWAFRRTFGVLTGFAYLLCFPIIHYNSIKKDNNIFSAYRNLHRGFFENR